MKAVEYRLPKEIDKSFIVFREQGRFFPCPWHYHPEFELVMIKKSTGRRMVGDHIGHFGPGDLVFMGSMLPHVWVNDPQYNHSSREGSADAIVIQFLDNFLGDHFLNLPEMLPLKNFLDLSRNGVAIKGKTRDRINALMDKMLSINGIQRLSSLFTIFDHLCHTNEYELLASPGYVQNTAFTCSDRFSNISEYIIRNFDRDISLPEIAGVANMAVTTFCNFFKEHFRTTFVEYLNAVRVGHACKLLARDNQNIIQIAYECGFNNLANFNRQFKKIKKMTPREYRRTLGVGDLSMLEAAVA